MTRIFLMIVSFFISLIFIFYLAYIAKSILNEYFNLSFRFFAYSLGEWVAILLEMIFFFILIFDYVKHQNKRNNLHMLLQTQNIFDSIDDIEKKYKNYLENMLLEDNNNASLIKKELKNINSFISKLKNKDYSRIYDYPWFNHIISYISFIISLQFFTQYDQNFRLTLLFIAPFIAALEFFIYYILNKKFSPKSSIYEFRLKIFQKINEQNNTYSYTLKRRKNKNAI